MMADGCWTCGAPQPAESKYCGRCGLPNRGAGALLHVLAPVATGVAAGAIALALSVFPTVPRHPADFVDNIMALALGTTLPFFDVAMGFVAGWAAVSTLRVRSAASVFVTGIATSAMYLAALFACSRISGHEIIAHGPGPVALAPILGSIAGAVGAARLGRATRLGPLIDWFGAARHPATALVALLSVVGILVLYGLLITAVVVTIAIITIVLGLRLVAAILGGNSTTTSRVRYSSGDVEHEQLTRRVEPMFGDPYNETRTADGEVITTSRRVEPLFGESYVETRDADGNVVGTTRRVDPLFGGSYVEKRDDHGNVVGTTRQVEPMFGESYRETRDGENRVVETSHKVEPLFGDAYVEHRNEKGEVVAESRRVEPLFGDAYVERKDVDR